MSYGDLSESLARALRLAKKVHLGAKGRAPEGVEVKVGPRGGRYYEVPDSPHPGRFISERARQAWRSRYGYDGENFGPNSEANRKAAERAKARRETEAGQEPPKEQEQEPPTIGAEAQTGFVTRMGSQYAFKDGRTSRDGGDWSDATVFLDPAATRAVADWQGEAKSNKRVHLIGDEVVLSSYSNMRGANVVDARVKVSSRRPAEGLAPLELFGGRGDDRARSFGEARTGNPIMSR